MSRLTRRLVVVTILLAACSWAEVERIEVEGWPVDCRGSDTAACGAFAARALNNLARSRPQEPSGVIVVSAPGACPVDDPPEGRPCWRVSIPLPGRAPACFVYARGSGVGGIEWVAGEPFGRISPRVEPNPRWCP